MRLFVCTTHATFWPVGGASIVVAEDEEAAKKLLDAALLEHGLAASATHPYTLDEISLDQSKVVILNDGEY